MKNISGTNKAERVIRLILDEERKARQEIIALRNEEARRQEKERNNIYRLLIFCISILSVICLLMTISLVYVNKHAADKFANVPKVEFQEEKKIEPIEIPIVPAPPTQREKSYEIPSEFKEMKVEMCGWVIDREYQEMAFNAAQKYNMDYLWVLAMIAEERSYNNPNAVHDNITSIDIGITQFNSLNMDIVRLVTKTDDVNILYKPWANIRCSVYLASRNKKHYKQLTSSYEEFICYNAGLGGVLNYMKGEAEQRVINYANEANANYKLLQEEYFGY